MDNNTFPDNEIDETVIDELMEQLETIYNNNLRIEQEMNIESEKHKKLMRKVDQLKAKANEITRTSDKLMKKIEFARASRIGTSVLTLVFAALWPITGFNPIMLTAMLVNLIATPLLAKYAEKISKKFKVLDKDVETILKLTQIYQEEEYIIVEKTKKLQTKLIENCNQFFDINDQIDKLEGVNSFELLKEELDEEIHSLDTEESYTKPN